MLTEPIKTTLKVVKAFERLGIPYLVGGSLASAVHGNIRATMDADLVADITPDHIASFVAMLESEFYIDGEMIRDAIQHSSSFNLIHLKTMFKIDVFIQKQRPFDKNQMQRRVPHLVGGEANDVIYFSTAEDIILAKLEWFRAGGEVSERQWRDIIGVLEIQGDRLDFDYMQKWAEALGVKDLLGKAEGEIEGN